MCKYFLLYVWDKAFKNIIKVYDLNRLSLDTREFKTPRNLSTPQNNDINLKLPQKSLKKPAMYEHSLIYLHTIKFNFPKQNLRSKNSTKLPPNSLQIQANFI